MLNLKFRKITQTKVPSWKTLKHELELHLWNNSNITERVWEQVDLIIEIFSSFLDYIKRLVCTITFRINPWSNEIFQITKWNMDWCCRRSHQRGHRHFCCSSNNDNRERRRYFSLRNFPKLQIEQWWMWLLCFSNIHMLISVIDFVAPYFDQSGISILLRKRKRETNVFKFLSVLKPEVSILKWKKNLYT